MGLHTWDQFHRNIWRYPFVKWVWRCNCKITITSPRDQWVKPQTHCEDFCQWINKNWHLLHTPHHCIVSNNYIFSLLVCIIMMTSSYGNFSALLALCARNSLITGDLRCHHAHYDITVILPSYCIPDSFSTEKMFNSHINAGIIMGIGLAKERRR